jgi:hypothetical protein
VEARLPQPASHVLRGWLGSVAGLLLAACLIPLAAPGAELVPGAGTDAPGWIMGVFGDGLGVSPGAYVALLGVAIVAWAALALAIADRRGRRLSRILWTGIAAAVLLFTLAPPLHSLDLFSYVSYGEIDAAEGLNPYEDPPEALSGNDAVDRVEDFRDTVSAYGPLFSLLSAAVVGLGSVAFSLWAFKLIAGLSVLAIAALTARVARVRGVPAAQAAAFVTLNPLTLAHVVGGGHNDALMIALVMAGVLALAGSRPIRGGAWIVAGAAVKASGALYAPFALAARGERLRVLGGMAAAALVLGLVALAFYGTSATEALAVAGNNQDTVSRWSLVATVHRGTGIDLDLLRALFVVIYGLAVIGLLAWTWRGGDWVRAAGWAAFGLLLATAWMVPWYLIWVLPFAAVSRDRLLIGGTVLLTLFQVANGIPV